MKSPLSPRPFLRIAHRGASGLAPENTLAAFRLALELGTDALECDLHRTRDGQVVVIHDDAVNRTTNGRGRVGDLTWAELQRLDAGSWFDKRFRGERIPCLEELLALARPHEVRLLLEIKVQGNPAEGMETAKETLRLVRRFALSRVTFLCFDARVVKGLGESRPWGEAGWLVKKIPTKVVERLRALGARALAPHWSCVNEKLVSELHEAGYPLIVWTVDEPERIKRLLRLGVDAIATNFPDRLNAVLRTAGALSR